MSFDTLKEMIQTEIKPNDDNIYHYTSPAGFDGIIKNKCLWFTNSNFLNDTTEGTFFDKILLEHLNQLQANPNINKEMLKYLTELCQSNLDQECYICSFSLEKDSLPMWNYYVKNDSYQGYNIRFTIDQFDFLTGWDTYDNIILIIYDEQKQKEIVERLVIELNSFFNNSTKDMSELKKYEALISKLRYAFKNKCFAHEKEVRVISHLTRCGDGSFFPPKQYRIGKDGYYIPYIEWPDKDSGGTKADIFNNLTIRMAPLSNYELAKESLDDFLKANNVSNCTILKSECPIRF